MKTNYIRSLILLAFAIGTGNILNAQTENTGERLITQLKNGTAPGLLFSNERPAPAPAQQVKRNERESLIAQMRKGTAPGMQFKQGGGAGSAAAVRVATKATGESLPSEKKQAVEQVKVAPVVVPKQE
ncbi:hypothetical protein [Niastella populi]|uniref:DUF4148 domain-containing protein n=1 Tax=Niastella populi TaxID=550983 RepID=A0A1V9FE32_9BACT|nr:hypothetical protein [Niastella populi]OQP56572.1 hypothetical protein A4R26_05270 [Niastella populi]